MPRFISHIDHGHASSYEWGASVNSQHEASVDKMDGPLISHGGLGDESLDPGAQGPAGGNKAVAALAAKHSCILWWRCWQLGTRIGQRQRTPLRPRGGRTLQASC